VKKIIMASVDMYHANWCGYCKSVMDDVIELQRTHRGRVDIRVMPSETPPPGGFRKGEGFPTFIVKRGNTLIARFSGADLPRLKGEIKRAMGEISDDAAIRRIIGQNRIS
jgi:thiol-disulfide isomerase/thioredoxin